MSCIDFSKIRAWVVGDVMLDERLYGVAERLSPESPVPIVRLLQRDASPGGAANTACNMASLGAHVTLWGAVGRDNAGDRVEVLVQQAGVSPRFARTSAVTTKKTRVTAQGHQIVRVDEEAREEMPAQEVLRMCEAMQAAEPPDIVVVSDYGKGAVTRPLLDTLIALSPKPRIVVDPKRSDFGFYRGADFIKPNEAEACQAAGVSSDALFEPAVIGELLERAAADLLITLGGRGMALVMRGEPIQSVPTQAREVFDVTGAGDTAAAVFALGLAAGLSPLEACHLANRAAGVAVSRLGTYVVTLDDLARTVVGVGGKVRSVAEAVAWREAEERADRKVVFTNGCFDVLHAGHVQLLCEARRLGDGLVVGVNDDCSVRRLKGPKRPVNPLEDRMSVLSSLAAVDLVVPFSQDTPLDLIGALRPDVLVKGADYTMERIVGADLVAERGGKVATIPLLSGRSTTGILRRSQ